MINNEHSIHTGFDMTVMMATNEQLAQMATVETDPGHLVDLMLAIDSRHGYTF